MSNFKNYFNYFILLLAFKKLYFLDYLIIYLNKFLKYFNIELDNCKLLYLNFYNKYYFKYYKINDEIYLLKQSKYNNEFNKNLYFKYYKILDQEFSFTSYYYKNNNNYYFKF